MENFSYHVPFYVVTGGIDTAGHSSELTAGQVGLFDRATFSVATAAGNGKELFFAQGAIGGKDWYGQPVTESHKSPFFYGKDVSNMYLSLPQTIQNEEWVIGFNGAASSKSLKFEKGRATRVKFFFHGNPINRFFGGPKEYVVSYTPSEDCSDPCDGNDCPEGITDCLTHTQTLIDSINTHTELKKFGVTAKLVNTPYSAVATNMTKWCLNVCDNGDVQALQAVKAQYPSLSIVRKSRVGSTSTYEFCQPDALAWEPADYRQSGSVSLAVCGVCPAGSTLTAGADTYFVDRTVTPSTDLSTGGAQQTYADSVGTAYEASLAATIATADVNTTTDVITETAHNFVTGQPVTYDDGGGAAMTGLVDNAVYYVIKLTANTFKVATTLANALAGTAINITGTGNNAQSFTPIITASFVALNGSVARVKLSIAQGATLNTLLADEVNFEQSVGATCVFSAPSDIAWVTCGTGISSERTMKIEALQREDCNGGDRLADLTSILSGVKGIKINTLTKIAGTNCADDYTVVQSSIDCLAEDCLTNNVTFTYDELPAFESKYWKLVPPAVSADPTRKCGIRVTAGYIDPQFGNCSFQPDDFYETEPIKMEVSLLGENDSNCDVANWPSVQQTRVGRTARQSGEWVVREVIMKTDAYLKHINQYSSDPRMREAFDQNLLGMVDRKAFYKLYYITYSASYGHSFRKNEQEKFTTIFAFKETDPTVASFETNIIDVLTGKSGVVLHVNS